LFKKVNLVGKDKIRGWLKMQINLWELKNEEN